MARLAAALHEELGNQALKDGYKLSAGEHLTRAAVCYHFGKFLFVNDLEQMNAEAEWPTPDDEWGKRQPGDV